MDEETFNKHIGTFLEYVRRMEDSFSRHWDIVNNTIMNFERRIKDHQEGFEKFYLNMLKKTSHDMEKEVRKIEEYSENLGNKLSYLSEQIAIIVTKQDIEEIVGTASTHALEQTKHFVNKDLWNDNLNQLFTFMYGVRQTIGRLADVVAQYDLASRSEPHIFFKTQFNETHPALEILVDDCELSVRTINSLRNYNFQTMKDVYVTPSKNLLLKCRNLGKTSINELKRWFESHQLVWA